MQVRKFRRRRLVQYHDLEQDLLREELNKRQNQLESAHSMLLRHHEMTQVRQSDSVLYSHWSWSNEDHLSLAKSFIVFLLKQYYATENQHEHPPNVGSLWHKDSWRC